MVQIIDVDFETVPFTEEEFHARVGRVYDKHPRINPRDAHQNALHFLESKYSALTSGEIGEVANGSNSGDV